jgi:hypothetical protein
LAQRVLHVSATAEAPPAGCAGWRDMFARSYRTGALFCDAPSVAVTKYGGAACTSAQSLTARACVRA